MTKTQKFALAPLAAALMLGGGAVAGYATLAAAQTPTTGQTATNFAGMHKGMMGRFERGGMGHGVGGTISAINGNTITVTGKDGKTYTVDASSATVTKIVQLNVSDLKVGDTVGVQGSVSGTSVAAKHIMDGIPLGRSLTGEAPRPDVSANEQDSQSDQ